MENLHNNNQTEDLDALFFPPSNGKAKMKKLVLSILIPIGSLLLSYFLVYHIPEIRKMVIGARVSEMKMLAAKGDSTLTISSEIETKAAKLRKKIDGYTPTTPYFVVNTAINEFWMYQNRQLVKHGMCSTGSYIQLEGNNKKWVFKTPRGEFKILGKTVDPPWKKPDWAFVEEGLPIPSANHPSRFEYGVLGDYSLSLGDGYLIHGTLYKRFLGIAVTHGCIRLGDEDLEKTFKTLNIGSKVYIY